MAQRRGAAAGPSSTAAKSHEITAIPQLFDAHDVKGATTTKDTMECQHEIVKKIVGMQAYCSVAVKPTTTLAGQCG